MNAKITEMDLRTPSVKKNPIPLSLKGEERSAIAKRAGETHRKNNAIISRFEKALNYKLMTEGKINIIANALVEAASDPKSRNFLGAARLIFGITGIEFSEVTDKTNPNITGENVQIVFAGKSEELAK